MKVKYGTGSAAIVMDDVLRDLVRRAIHQAAPTVAARLERGVVELEEAARARWPVKRQRGHQARREPHSRDLFGHGLQLLGEDTAAAFVGNSAPYTRFIRSMQNGLGGKSAWVTLVRTPAHRMAEQMANDLGASVASELRRGR